MPCRRLPGRIGRNRDARRLAVHTCESDIKSGIVPKKKCIIIGQKTKNTRNEQEEIIKTKQRNNRMSG